MMLFKCRLKTSYPLMVLSSPLSVMTILSSIVRLVDEAGLPWKLLKGMVTLSEQMMRM